MRWMRRATAIRVHAVGFRCQTEIDHEDLPE
jgi:hypothetical protein